MIRDISPIPTIREGWPPRESAERLGGIDENTGDSFLIDGQVEARSDEMELDGERLPVWSAGSGRLIVKPAVRSPTIGTVAPEVASASRHPPAGTRHDESAGIRTPASSTISTQAELASCRDRDA